MMRHRNAVASSALSLLKYWVSTELVGLLFINSARGNAES
jgi:hypothetical protein